MPASGEAGLLLPVGMGRRAVDLHSGQTSTLQLVREVDRQLAGAQREVGRRVRPAQQAAPLERQQCPGHGGQRCNVRPRDF